jgi:hypothetical protein
MSLTEDNFLKINKIIETSQFLVTYRCIFIIMVETHVIKVTNFKLEPFFGQVYYLTAASKIRGGGLHFD